MVGKNLRKKYIWKKNYMLGKSLNPRQENVESYIRK